jgi:MFS family permease
VLVDRFDRRRIMLACDVGACLAIASLPVALALGALSFTQLGVVAFVEGVCATLFRIAETPAVRQLVPPEQLPAAIAQNQTRVYGAAGALSLVSPARCHSLSTAPRIWCPL